jgi:hypothetical protein
MTLHETDVTETIQQWEKIETTARAVEQAIHAAYDHAADLDDAVTAAWTVLEPLSNEEADYALDIIYAEGCCDSSIDEVIGILSVMLGERAAE